MRLVLTQNNTNGIVSAMNDEHAFERFRKAHGLTQAELAEKLGISQARVSHYITGRSPLPVDVAHDFIRVARRYRETFALEDLYPASAA